MRIIGSGLAVAAGVWVTAGLLTHPMPARAATFHTDFEAPIFAEAPNLYAKDHTLIQHDDGVFHLFYASGNAGEGWNLPGNEINIGHATSTDLIHWSIHPRILPIDLTHNWKNRNVWAPHVIAADIQIGPTVWPYLMSYTGVNLDRNQQIGLAVSADLFNWTDLSVQDGAFRPNSNWAAWDPDSTWQNCRDSFILRQSNQFLMLTTVTTRPEYLGLGTRGAIALATSQNGLNWVDQGSPLVINDHWTLMASSHLMSNPVSGEWHLLYTRPVDPGGVHMLTSTAADQNWDMSNDVVFDLASISSEITATDGADIYSQAKDFNNQAGLETWAVRFDNVTWSQNGPVYPTGNQFWDNWTLVEGQLGAMPTYRDRPGSRTAVPSNVDGLFWVNTAENDSGPYGLGCATCAASEALTGVLRSDTFTINHRTVRLRVGGTASPQAYVALVDAVTGTPLRTAQGLGTDVMSVRQWDTNDLLGRSVYFEIVDRTATGHVSVDKIEAIDEIIGVPETPPPALSGAPTLGPNPSSGPVVFTYDLARDALVSLSIYGADGRLIRRLQSGAQTARRHEIPWDGRLTSGERAAAGVYYFRLMVKGEGGKVSSTVMPLAVVR
jgi:hypothetical protein